MVRYWGVQVCDNEPLLTTTPIAESVTNSEFTTVRSQWPQAIIHHLI